jgi:mono/diheme cytochrome c family protein
MKEMLKKIALSVVLLPLLGLLMINASAPRTRAAGEDFDAAGTFKAKCVMCHTATASKNFDASKTDEQLTEAILKGVKGEKPPFMPGYEAKGITAEQAKALAAYMRSVKQ